MATNLSAIGLEHLTKSAEWNWLNNSLVMGGGNARQAIEQNMMRFGKEVEIVVGNYYNTINELKKETKFLFEELQILKAEMCSEISKKNIIIEEQAKSLQELVSENSKLLIEFKSALTALTIKKPAEEEIAELQTRIMELYAKRGKN